MYRSAVALAVASGLVSLSIASAAALFRPAEAAQAVAPGLLSPQHPQSLVDALHAAVRAGSLERVRELVAAGADVNARDPLGSTPLFVAAWAGNTEIASFLLVHGAAVNASRPERNATSLEAAVLTVHTELVHLM